MASKRPNMRDYFAARIDWHVHGMASRMSAVPPRDVARVNGDVTSDVITVTMRDGSTWQWTGGQYAARKVHGCYAPKQPTPITPEPSPV